MWQAALIILLHFLRTPCRRSFQWNYIGVSSSIVKKSRHFMYPVFHKVIVNVPLVWVHAGKTCPCVSMGTYSFAIFAFTAFDNLLSFCHVFCSFFVSDISCRRNGNGFPAGYCGLVIVQLCDNCSNGVKSSREFQIPC